MPKFFCVSDLHGFYTEFISALNEAGFDSHNEDHILVVCGDCFDRGAEPIEIWRYLMQLPRKILIRGNHEDLLEECCYRGEWLPHDYGNGTVNTIQEFGRYGDQTFTFQDACVTTEKRLKNFFKSMRNYFETENYIFVHGWIPVVVKDGLPVYYTKNRQFEYDPNWREAHAREWEQARWLNGIDMARKGIIESGKTIVCGHWHCSYGHMLDSLETDNWLSEFDEDAVWEPYYGKGIIAIDGCTVHTGKVNVLVIEDNFIE